MKLNPNHIHLFGDPEENFYILGKRDKDSYIEMYDQISMLCTRNSKMSKVLKLTTELSGQIKKKKYNSRNLRELQAYAEGLEKPINDVLYALLLPEIVASFNKWVPNLLGVIPGCSSLFMKDPKNGDIIHSRVLDYALSGPFEKYERSVLYDFKDRYKSFSLSSSGMPLPSMTVMNEKGLTLALHYKHGQYFNLDGESIFFLTSEIMNQCSNIREAIKYIKTKQSISYWGLYLSDSNGEVASIDIRGPEIYQEKFDLKDHDYLYFSNRPLLRQPDQESIQPFGNLDLCQMKRNSIEHRLKSFDPTNSKNLTMDCLKILGKPNIKKAKSGEKWNASTITPSSIQLISFNSAQKSAIMIPGEGPKFFLNQYVNYSDIFSSFKINTTTKKSSENKYIAGFNSLAKYQSSIDKGEITNAYHQIQMAIEHFIGFPEFFVAKFYFAITQYIYESDTRDLTYLYHDFENLNGKLPHYLEDHRKLFILRLGKIIGHKINNKHEKIKNPDLKKIYLDELKLNAISIKGLKYLIFPRVEIFDVIYAY
jgi:hypothetical protein